MIDRVREHRPKLWDRVSLPIQSVGLIGFGATAIAFRDFLLQSQPVTAALPDRPLWAVGAGLLLVGIGVALLVRKLTVRAATAALAVQAVWAISLLRAQTLAMPTVLASWLGAAEIGSIALGSAVVLASAKNDARLLPLIRSALGACAIVFGACHFAYPNEIAAMVPAWLPNRLLWAYATGCGHLLAGVALLFNLRPRLAATLLAAMCASFVILVHLPRVIALPTAHVEWVLLFVSLSITGAYASIRDYYRAAAACIDPDAGGADRRAVKQPLIAAQSTQFTNTTAEHVASNRIRLPAAWRR